MGGTGGERKRKRYVGLEGRGGEGGEEQEVEKHKGGFGTRYRGIQKSRQSYRRVQSTREPIPRTRREGGTIESRE